METTKYNKLNQNRITNTETNIKKMKKFNYNYIKLVLIIITFSLVSCEKGIFGIKGEGEIVSQEYDLSELSGIILNAEGNIHLTQSDTQLVIIKAQQNILNNLEMPVNNSVLNIDFDKNVKSHDGLDIYLSLKAVEKAHINGSGNINTTSIFNQTESLEIGISGSGNIDISCNTEEIYSQLTGSGTIKITTITDYLSTDITGSGEYILSGSAKECEHSISGSGDIKAFNLETQSTNMQNTGSANGELWVNDKLIVSISGSGDIYYKGTPEISVDITGSGNLIKQ